MTRTNKAIKNVVYATTIGIFTIIIGLLAQRVFINTLGTEYLGINGLLSGTVSMLALVELGLGSAVYFNLYKPINEGDVEKVKSLINFYKHGYRIIAVAVFLLGLCIVPFLSIIVGNVNIGENIYLIYILILLDVVFSYLFTYKRVVLFVDQNNHIISLVHLGYLLILNFLQITVLIITKNFYLYLLAKLFTRLLENFVVTSISNRKYTYLKEKSINVLDKKIKSDIYKKIRGLSYHRIGEYVVLGTDNIIISIFLGITTVGLYSNYLLVIGAIGMLMSQAFTAITASVGNLLVKVKYGKSFEIFQRLQFGNFWLASFAATSLLVIMNSFITLWIGEKYLLSLGVLVALSFSLFLTLFRSSINSFKEAAGIFHQDRFVPVIESIANLIFSLTFLHFFGLAGVFIGTAFSTLILHLFSYPKYVFKPLFKKSYKLYYLAFFKYLFLAFFIGSLSFVISRSFTVNGKLSALLVNVIICIIIPNFILFSIFRKNSDFIYYKRLAYKIIRRTL